MWTINTTQQKTYTKQRENQKQTQANPQITNNNQTLQRTTKQHNPGISRHQPSVVCWTSWPAQPGQDGREFRQPGGAQKRVTHPGEAEDS